MLHVETGTLPAHAPFDFSQSLAFLQGFSPTQDDLLVTATALTRAIMINGRCIAFRLQAYPNGQTPAINYTLFSETPFDDQIKQEVTKRIAFFLSLEDDLNPFYARAQEDPAFAPVVRQLYGFHHVKFLTLVEIASWAVLTQRRPIALARKMKQALIERYGGKICVDGKIYHAFPDLECLATVDYNELAALLQNTRTARYLCEVVQSLSQLDERVLQTMPYEKAEETLLRIKGIGPWSAMFILLRGLGRMEYVRPEPPLVDAFARVYGAAAQVEHVIQFYGIYAGYWGFYLRNAV